jgi:hypothetical protein
MDRIAVGVIESSFPHLVLRQWPTRSLTPSGPKFRCTPRPANTNRSDTPVYDERGSEALTG